MRQKFPLYVVIPAILGNDLVQMALGTEVTFISVSAYLRTLVTGPHVMQARRLSDNSVVGGQLTFNAAGLLKFSGFSEYAKPDETLTMDVTTLGIGASEIFMVLWGLIPQTLDN